MRTALIGNATSYEVTTIKEFQGTYVHIGANLIPDSVFKPMSKNQNDDNDYLRLFSIVFFAVESDSGVKWSLKLVQGPKKEDLEA